MKYLCLAFSFSFVVSIVLAGSVHAQVSFFQPPGYAGNGTPYVADFNGDGKLDILTSDGKMNLGNGDGTFTPGVSLSGTNAMVFAVADFNGDGRPDVLQQGTGTLLVLLGNGDGTFQAPISSPAVQSLGAIAAVDLNGDGKADVVGMCCNGGGPSGSTLFVYISKGDGTFLPAVQYNLGFVPQSPGAGLSVGDFSGDGKVDVAVSASGGTQAGEEIVFLGNGDGTFQTTPKVSPGLWVVEGGITVGDFNGDGKLDLALIGCDTASCIASTFILAGNGDGTFQSPTAVIDDTAGQMLAADLNGDGKLDLAVPSVFGPMGIYLGNGDGTFSNTANYLGRGALAIADFNGDGKLDLAGGVGVPNSGSGVILGNGDGTFHGIPDALLPFLASSLGGIVIGDFEKSGFPDAAVVATGPNIYILHNHVGTLLLSHTYTISQPQAGASATGDFNGDGNLDLIVAGIIDPVAGTWGYNVLLGNGNGSFQAPVFYQQSIPGPGPGFSLIVVADFNNDKKLDFAIMSGSDAFAVFLGNGDGTFAAPLTMSLLNGAGLAGAADFNGDGKLDIAAGTGILFGNGDGTFQAEVSVPNWNGTAFITDLNNDGKPDLVSWASGQVALGKGDGTFTVLGSPSSTEAVSAVADVNGDGKPDELVVDTTEHLGLVTATGFRLGNGDGTFGPLIQVPTNGLLPIGQYPQPTFVSLADMNGDGRPDIVFVPDGIAVMLNTTQPGFEVIASAISPATVTAGNSATSTVTVLPTFGFNQTVTLTCTGIPSGANCAFNPATIPKSSGTSSLTITTSASLSAGTYALQVQGSAGSTVNSVPVSLVVGAAPDFTVGAASGSPSSLTVTAGQTASFSLALVGTGSFLGTVNLSCAITPAATPAPTCSLSSSSVQISGTGTQTVTVKVGTTAPVSGIVAPHATFPSGLLPLLWALIFLGSLWFWARNRKRQPVLATPIIVLFFAFSVGCGGSSSSSTHTTPGTPAGTYTATATATSGSTSHNIALQVTVR